MFQEILSAIQSVCGALNSGDFQSLDLNAMNSGFDQNLNVQMQACMNDIVQTNMNNPHVQQMYQTHRQQGGMLDFPTYCAQYAETGGFTAAGMQRLAQSRTQIQANDQRNMNAYRECSANLQQETTACRHAVQDKWANQRGENLAAQATFVNGADGTAWQLPTNLSPGQVAHDPGSGNVFAMDVHGQYWMSDGQGWWQSMNYRG